MAKKKQLTDLNIQMKEHARPRAEAAIKMRESGMKWREVGEKLGVTGQRAWALVRAHKPEVAGVAEK